MTRQQNIPADSAPAHPSTLVPSTSVPATSVNVLERIFALPRIGKIALVALIAVVVVLFVTPAIDYLYLTQFFTMETRMAPSLVAAVAGVIMYGVGWYLLLWDDRQRRVGLALYLMLAAIALIGVIALTIYGLVWAGQG